MHSTDFSKISITAKLVAYYRQFSDIAYADEVARYVDAEAAVHEIASKLSSSSADQSDEREMLEEAKVFGPLFEARYKSVVRLIRETGITQVLELASGFSLRGFSMTQNSDVTYVESDLDGINSLKSTLIQDLRQKYSLPDCKNYHIATANALSLADLENAIRPLNSEQKLLVVHEGLAQYFSTDETALLASNISTLLKTKFKGGAWITPDFATKQVADNVSERMKRFRLAVAGTTDRELYKAAFASDDAIEAFAKDHGFDPKGFYQADLVQQFSSLDRLQLEPAVLEILRPRMRVWLFSPQ